VKMPRISIERREKPIRPEPKYPWLVWVFIVAAVLVLVGFAYVVAVRGIPLF
jgi:polyferredoxin